MTHTFRKRAIKVLFLLMLVCLFTPDQAEAQMRFAYTELPGTNIAFQAKRDEGTVYVSSQPSALGISGLAQKGIKTVISLRSKKDIAYKEAEIVRINKMKFYDFPFTRNNMDFKMIKSLESLLRNKSKYPVLIHGEDMELVATIMAIKAIELGDASLEEGIALAKFLGLREQKMINAIRSYVRD